MFPEDVAQPLISTAHHASNDGEASIFHALREWIAVQRLPDDEPSMEKREETSEETIDWAHIMALTPLLYRLISSPAVSDEVKDQACGLLRYIRGPHIFIAFTELRFACFSAKWTSSQS
jgi:hypothetical protein